MSNQNHRTPGGNAPPVTPQQRCAALGELLRWCVGAVVLLLVSQTFFVLGLLPPVVVSGDSMSPTLPSGKRIWIDRMAYCWRNPQRGDVVVLPCPDRAWELCVKRIAGLPGESVQIVDGQLWINGQPHAFAGSSPLGPKPGLELGASVLYQLGQYEYFLLGDNAATSQDSRVWHPPTIHRDRLAGRVLGTP